MKNKKNRLDVIKQIISARDISSQEELLQALKAHDFNVTQATLSRDLKQLKVAKASNNTGAYVYVLPNNTLYRRVGGHEVAVDPQTYTGFLSIRFTGNLAVIRTRPGYASRMAYDIDNANFESVLGTVAGDDTIFLAIDAVMVPGRIVDELRHVIPDIHY